MSDMNEQSVELTPAEENPWYQLYLLSRKDREQPERLWNGYQRYLLEEHQYIDVPIKMYESLPILPDFEKLDIERSISSLSQMVNSKDWMTRPRISFYRNWFENSLGWEKFIFGFDTAFEHCEFRDGVYLNGSKFFSSVSFNGSEFSSFAGFNSVDFFKFCRFEACKFQFGTGFVNAKFFGFADFGKAAFAKQVTFASSSFFDIATFRHTEFSQDADFSDQRDSGVSGSISFYHADFLGCPPKFFQRTLHQDTDWTNSSWPTPRDRILDIEQDIRAYERLRLISKDQGSLAQEYLFFRQEMACKTKLHWKKGRYPTWALHWLYGLFDYGHSITAPLIGLFTLWLAGIAAWREGMPATHNDVDAMGHSLANIFPFFRIVPRREIWTQIPDWLIAVSGLQSFLGLGLLFLFGLALRSALRMR